MVLLIYPFVSGCNMAWFGSVLIHEWVVSSHNTWKGNHAHWGNWLLAMDMQQKLLRVGSQSVKFIQKHPISLNCDSMSWQLNGLLIITLSSYNYLQIECFIKDLSYLRSRKFFSSTDVVRSYLFKLYWFFLN